MSDVQSAIAGDPRADPAPPALTEAETAAAGSLVRTPDPESLRYRRLFESIPEPMWVYDVESLAFLAVNDAAVQRYGYSREEFLGMTLREIRPAEDVPALMRNVVRAAAGTAVERAGVWRHLKKDGTVIDVEISSHTLDFSGRPARLAMAIDVTERRQSELRYRDLFENANDMIYTVDLIGNLTSANRMTELITGYSREELGRMHFEELVAPEYLDTVRESLRSKLAGEIDGNTYELEIVAKDGRRVPLEVRARVLRQDGRVVGIEGIARDVSQRKALEGQLRQSQKMEAVGRLAGGVAHDFNNLLTAILGYSHLLLRRLGDRHDLRREVEEIGKAGERAASLTAQLLAFSRKQVLQARVLDLNGVVRNVEKMLRCLIGEDVTVSLALAGELGRIRADPSQIEQVLLNLAVNARDAMPGGGKLTIETANVELGEASRRQLPLMTVSAPGPYVMLAVSDDGCGMDEETQSHVFEPFFTTKAPGKGTGLGLATVYGIVQQSAGYIRLESRPGRGTRFTIYLPRVEAEVEPVRPAPSAMALARGSETVLLVEDEDSLRALARQVLEESGYRVLEAHRAEEGLLIARGHAEPIHLLVSDVIMPGLSGPRLAEQIAEIHPRTKVLYISGYADRPGQQGLPETDAPILQKPFTPQTLATRVREVLDRS